MSETDFYTEGYADSSANRPPAYPDNETYLMGFHDAQGDEELKNTQAAYRPVDDEYALLGDAPAGFDWAGYKKTPEPGDYYLTKAGGAKYATKVRKNSQQRHILLPIAHCNCYDFGGGYGNKAACPQHAKVSK